MRYAPKSATTVILAGKIEDRAKFILGAISPNWHWNTLEFVEITEKVSGDVGIARAVLSGVYENAEGISFATAP